MTRAALEAAEEKFGASFNLTQGSYVPGYGPSAGTHDGGGVVDLVTDNPKKAVKALADTGFAPFYRPPNWDNAGGIAHVHAALKANKKLARLARVQADWYDRGRDGLGSSYTSPPFGVNNGYVPAKPVEFNYAKWQKEQSLLARIKRLTRQRERITQNVQEARRRLRAIKH